MFLSRGGQDDVLLLARVPSQGNVRVYVHLEVGRNKEGTAEGRLDGSIGRILVWKKDYTCVVEVGL